MAENRCPSCLREYVGERCSCGYPEKGQNASHQLPVGTVLRGRYMIGKALGQGGFGITYLAWDKLMQTAVAVKEFYPGGTVFRKSATSLAVECGTEEIIPHYEYSKERFLREAGALVKFKDIPEIVDILDFAEENNTAYIVMEYVRGMDLAKYVAMKGGKLSPEETFRILRPVMEALAKVHKGGIVHRDISPDNIILDPLGGAKLLDFGAVRAVEDPDVDKGLNKSTEAILKQGFAPIEQYNTRGNLGPWTDEYAVCATVWYCLTGTVPAEASIRVSEGIDPDWAGIPGLPAHQQKALEMGMACRAKDRYRSLDELLEALFPSEEKMAVSPEPMPAAVRDARPMKAEKDPAENKKKPFIWFAAAVALLILIAAALFLPGKQEQRDPQLQEAHDPSVTEVPQHTEPNAPETVPTLPETVPTTKPLSKEELSYLQAEQLLAEGKLGEAAIAFGKLAAYADARARSFEIWDRIAFRDTIAAGSDHTVGLKTDGTVVAQGNTNLGRCDVTGWSDIVAVSAGSAHTVGLRTDGTVVAVGDPAYGMCNIEGWSDIVAVSAGGTHTVGLRADGSVIATGANGTSKDYKGGQCDVEDWSNVAAIATGWGHTVGLKTDSTVLAVGFNMHGQCRATAWGNIVAIAAGEFHTVGLLRNGHVIAEGSNVYGQCYISDWTDIRIPQRVNWYAPKDMPAEPTPPISGEDANAEAYANAEQLLAEGKLGEAAIAFGKLAAYADARARSFEIWDKIAVRETVSAGVSFTAALKNDGTVVGTGWISSDTSADALNWTDIIAISSGSTHIAGLKADGTVVAEGDNEYGQCNVESWTDIVAISTRGNTTVGLRADGTVIATGENDHRQCDLWGWYDIVSISAASMCTFGLKTDGTVITAGGNSYGMCDVEDWTDIVAITSCFYHSLGIRSDGSIVAAGDNSYGQCYNPRTWTDIVALAAGGWHSVGLRSDGTVVAAGWYKKFNQCSVGDWKDIVAISAGFAHTVGLRSDGTVVATGRNWSGECEVWDWTNIRVPEPPLPFR